ncbi:MAG: hypothetical protein KAR06_05405, partial [Deltaproteobacteria bacterium]|nr:hypothetical protein [Deltaproteobacteria bacterium]
RAWTVQEERPDGSTFSIDETVKYLPDSLMRMWVKYSFPSDSSSEFALVTALFEVDCANDMQRPIHIDLVAQDGEKLSLDTPYTEPPYDWEPIDPENEEVFTRHCK